MTDRSESIFSFWDWFVDREADLSRVTTGSEPVLDDLLLALHRIDPGLFFEVCANTTPHELILTVEGNADRFALADEVVAAAPKIDGWVFMSCKPALGFGFATKYEDLDLDPGSMWFLPLESKSNSDALGLRVAIPLLDPSRAPSALKAATMMLNTALGERELASILNHVEVVSLPPDPAGSGYLELKELGEYIERRKRKRGRRT